MAVRVTVRITGGIGLDDADELLADLAKETPLDWWSERPGNGKHLGAEELIVTAVIGGLAGKGTEMAVEAILGQVREVIHRMQRKHLDPPDVDIETEEAPGPDPGPDSGTSAGDGPRPRAAED